MFLTLVYNIYITFLLDKWNSIPLFQLLCKKNILNISLSTFSKKNNNTFLI